MSSGASCASREFVSKSISDAIKLECVPATAELLSPSAPYRSPRRPSEAEYEPESPAPLRLDDGDSETPATARAQVSGVLRFGVGTYRPCRLFLAAPVPAPCEPTDGVQESQRKLGKRTMTHCSLATATDSVAASCGAGQSRPARRPRPAVHPPRRRGSCERAD